MPRGVSMKKMLSVTVAVVTLLFFSCEEEVAVTGVALNQTVLALTGGEEATLMAVIEPANAAIRTVRWSVEPENALTLIDNKDGTCTVTGAIDGKATVTVTTDDGGKTAQCRIGVNYSITNTVFIRKVRRQCDWTVESDGTVKLTAENLSTIRSVTKLSIYGVISEEEKLTDLSDIEWFTGLKELDCSSHNLTALDVSNNTALTVLNCGYNALTALDVSKNTALTDLSCSGNNLTALDVSNNTALTDLSCSGVVQRQQFDSSGCFKQHGADGFVVQRQQFDSSGCVKEYGTDELGLRRNFPDSFGCVEKHIAGDVGLL